MNNINEIITKNFQSNISYIQANHPSLFSKLSALDSALELGHYKEKYSLVYENNNFDVVEKGTSNYLYKQKSSQYAKLAVESIDYKIQNNLFKGFHEQTVSLADLQHYEEEPEFAHQMSGFAPIMYICQQNFSVNKTLKNIKKFIFFGVGLGLHITSIHKKISSEVYFIVEDDLELFRLSLFTTNYQEIAEKSTLIFSVFENNDEFLRSAESFLKKQYYYNQYLKYFQMLSYNSNKIKQFHLAVASQSHLLFFYNSLLTQYLKPLDYLFEDYKFLNSSLSFSNSKLNKKPFLLLAAGPSLEKNIVWLQKNHKNFVTVAISATLSYLEEKGISPNIITHLDSFDAATVHFDKLHSHDFIQNSICIFSSRIPSEITSRFQKSQLFFMETGTNYKKTSLKVSAPCIGSLTYQLLLTLKVKNLYLLGLDLSIDSKSGKTHSSSHQYIQTLSTRENAFDNPIMTYKDSTFYIQGNFSEKVLTTPNFKSSIETINFSTKHLKQETESVFNLSDGVKFNDTTPKHIEDVEFSKENQDITQEYLHQLCQSNASFTFEEQDMHKLQQQLLHAKDLHKFILNIQQNFTPDTFLESLKALTSKILLKQDLKTQLLNRVIDTYLKYILTFIFDYYNRQESVNFKDEELCMLLTGHILKIINYYHDTIQTKIMQSEQ